MIFKRSIIIPYLYTICKIDAIEGHAENDSIVMVEMIKCIVRICI